MIYQDDIYGPIAVDEVLVSLMNSEPVQRLKNISQGGAVTIANPSLDHTRYDHSVGVMHLIKRLNGSLQEQIAGLLHDISHTAFSHLVDYVLENHVEDYHETIFRETISHPTIIAVLSSEQLNVEEFFDLDKFSILEYPLPGLCADRIDYTLRDLFKWQHITKADIDWFLDGLLVVDNRIVVKNVAYARWFKEKYTCLTEHYFKEDDNRLSNLFMKSIVQKYYRTGQITLNDFKKDDAFLIKKIENLTGNDIHDLYRHWCRNNVDKPDFTRKKRIIDPEILYEDRIIKLSELSS